MTISKLAIIISCFLSILTGCQGRTDKKPDTGNPPPISDHTPEAIKQELQSLPFKHIEWDLRPGSGTQTFTRVTLASENIFVETKANRVYTIERRVGEIKWLWDIDTNTPLDYPPVIAYGLPEEIAHLEKRRALIIKALSVTEEGARIEFDENTLKEMIPEIGQMDKEYTNVLSELEDEKKKDTPDPAKMKELQTKAKEVNLKLIESLRKQRSADTEKLIAAKKGDNVYLLSKNTLYCIDRLIGKLLWRKRLNFVASASPFAVKSYVFIPSAVKDRVYVLDVAREGEEVAYCKAESEQADGNDITTQPFYEDPNIFFVSHNGRIYSFNAPRNDFNWIYQTNGAIKAPPTVYFYRWGGEKDWKKFLFIGSFDYGLYAFDADSGGLMWKYECGGVFKTPAIARDGTVYVKTENGYLFALNVRPMHMDKGFATGEKRNGELRWKLPLGERFLVKGKERVYVLGPEKEIYAINEMSGEIRGRYKTDILKFLITNTIDDVFYVATENGYIFALKESAKEF